MPDGKTTLIKMPTPGEKTEAQRTVGTGDDILLKGFEFPIAPKSTYKTWREMMSNPAIALARAVARAPIRAGGWTAAGDDDVPEDRMQFINDQFSTLWNSLVRDALLSLDYGWQGFEKVFEVVDGRFQYAKLKALTPDRTDILADEKGAFAGLKQGETKLAPLYCYVFTHDEQHGNCYGRPRIENCREDWHQQKEIMKREGTYVQRVAAPLPIVYYPPGQSIDKSGNTRDNYDLAKSILSQLSKSHGVTIPKLLLDAWQSLVQAGAPAEMLLQWSIDYLEAKQQHGSDFVNLLRYHDSRILRGYLVPERTAIEGQMGTKAEATAHADIAIAVAELLRDELIASFNHYLVNPLLVLNWGDAAQDTVWLQSEGLAIEQKAFLRDVIKALFAQPMNIDLVTKEWVDVRQMVEQSGLPLVERPEDAEPKEEPERGPEPSPETEPEGPGSPGTEPESTPE